MNSSQGQESDDDLFGVPGNRRTRPTQYETIATLPVDRVTESPDRESSVLLPNIPQYQAQSQYRPVYSYVTGEQGQQFTQPTQILPHSPGYGSTTDVSSPVSRPVVHVTASSPITTPRANGSNGFLGNAVRKGTINIAPAGTQFAPQYRNTQSSSQQNSSQYTPQNGSQYVSQYRPESQMHDTQAQYAAHSQYLITGESDEEERAERERNKVHRRFDSQGEPLRRPSPMGSFRSLMNTFSLDSDDPRAGKRSSDTMASSYGGVTKKQRQLGPSRAQPVPHNYHSFVPPVHDINEISDPNERNKVKRILETLPGVSVAEALQARGVTKDWDAAVLLLSARREHRYEPAMSTNSSRTPIVLPSSDDELMMTPRPRGVATSNYQQPQAAQPARRPVASIAQRYGSTQHQHIAPAPQGRYLNAFDTPPPQEAKKRTLMRGRKNRSPSPVNRAIGDRRIITLDDSGDEGDSGLQSGHGDSAFDDRVLSFFNSCTALELSDISGLPKDHAEHVLASRPFSRMQKVFNVQNPKSKSKSNKGSTSFGERTWDKVYEMMKSYEAVDSIVTTCQEKSKPLARSMSSWGVDVYGKGKDSTGLDLVNLPNTTSQDSSGKDSGLGTPISDDGDPASAAKKGFIMQPTSLAGDVVMKDYQIVGLNWLHLLYRHQLSGILADDMGLGKTLQTIAFLAHLKSLGVGGPHLIVVPSATLENWLKEFKRFAPSLNVHPYYGSMAEREQMRFDYEEDRDNINVLVTTYVIAKAKEDIPWLRRFGFTCAVFDEGHMLKNPTSEVATKLTRIKTKFRLLLTGTPLQNNLNELMGLLKFLQPEIFDQYEEDLQAIFKQSISVTTDAAEDSRSMLLSKQRINRARSMLTPFILRRKKWQVLKDLPKKTRHVEMCDMSAEQVEIYNRQLAKAWDVRQRKERGERVPPDESANILIRLRQAAIHPLLFRHFYSDKTLRRIAKTCPRIEQFRLSNPDLIMTELVAYADFETHDLCSKHSLLHSHMLPADHWECSGKVLKMLELLTKFKEDGHRTLIFSQFVMVLDILQIILNNRNIRFLRLDGSTRVDERQDLIDLFNADESEFEVFILSTKAGGAGINLTGASRVIVFDSGFNPQDDVQAENRCHRIGQTKDVEIYRLVSEDTVEEQIYEMGKIKLQLDKEVSGADGTAGAIDVPISGVATPAEVEEEAVGKKGKGKKTATDLSKREQEGAAMIEDLLFQKLEQQETQEVAPKRSPPRLKVKRPTAKKGSSLKKELNMDDIDAKSDSGLSDLSSLDSDDERLKRNDSEPVEIVDIVSSGRSRRKAAAKASENLKDPLEDELQISHTRGPRKSKKELVGKTPASQSTISRSGRLIKGVTR